jgi:hypothetical protein
MATTTTPKELNLVERFMQNNQFCSESYRFETFLTEVLMAQFDEFEKLEREKLHNREIPKIMREIKGDIAKAKIERRRKITKEFSSLHIAFHIEGNPEKWPIAISKETFPSMFKTHYRPDLTHYFDRHDWLKNVEAWRRVGIWRQVIGRLLKKKGLKLTLERDFTGSGWGGGGTCVLVISW